MCECVVKKRWVGFHFLEWKPTGEMSNFFLWVLKDWCFWHVKSDEAQCSATLSQNQKHGTEMKDENPQKIFHPIATIAINVYSYLSNKCEVTLILFWTFGNWILSYLSSHTYFFQGNLKICMTFYSNFVSFSCWITQCYAWNC